MNAAAQPAEAAEGVFLGAYLAPFRRWLDRADVTDILVNQPGEVWIESGGATAMERIDAPEIDNVLLRRLAEQVARTSHQAINRQRPLLGATLPDGARVQFVGPPATRGDWALAIRRHRLVDVPLDAYGSAMIPRRRAPAIDPARDPIACLREAVAARQTILISGGTSTGKTTFLNALLGEIPPDERIVLVEDTPEIRIRDRNAVGLVAVKGELGEAIVTADDLLQASLRMRPDRIVLGELRGTEAVSFLRAINTGHPGSFSTVHANSPAGALEQLALMVAQANLGFNRQDILAYASSVIDLVVQLDRSAGARGISAIVKTGDIRLSR